MIFGFQGPVRSAKNPAHVHEPGFSFCPCLRYPKLNYKLSFVRLLLQYNPEIHFLGMGLHHRRFSMFYYTIINKMIARINKPLS